VPHARLVSHPWRRLKKKVSQRDKPLVGALNKWLKQYVPEGCVIHFFRHSMRDRLRAVQCPSDIIDQIGGWTTAGVGQRYGEGHTISVLYGYLEECCGPDNIFNG